MSKIGHCAICGDKARIFECTNETCKKWVCADCSNDFIAPMIEYYYKSESLPILKCPNCGSDLKKDFSGEEILR